MTKRSGVPMFYVRCGDDEYDSAPYLKKDGLGHCSEAIAPMMTLEEAKACIAAHDATTESFKGRLQPVGPKKKPR